MKKNKLPQILVFVLVFSLFGIMAMSQPATGGTEGNPPSIISHSMSLLDAVVLGLTEGITEYLPVSSTGHLYLAGKLLGMGQTPAEKEAVDAYSICIQLGAILAVFWLYFARVRGMAMGLIGKDIQGRKNLINIMGAFIPAAVIGLLFEKHIKHYLFGIWPIILSWFVGGVVILLISGWMKRQTHSKQGGLDSLRLKSALLIGFMQCIAMWPGTSRSLVTILGGMLVGLSLPAAVEFSFLLGLITLSAATVYEGYKLGPQIISMFGWINPLIGLAVAFISAAAAVKWMVSYLNRHPLTLFGYYRIGLAIVAALWFI